MLDRTQQLEIRELTDISLGPLDDETILSNGVVISSLTDNDIDPLCRITVVLPGGTAEAKVGALAALSVNQMRDGTSDMSGEEIADKLDTSGAWLTETANNHSRILSLSCLTRNAVENVKLLASIITDPVYPKLPFATNVERAAARMEIDLTKVSVNARREAMRLIFGDRHPAYHLEYPDQIRALVPEDAVSFNSTMGTPAGMHVFVSGYRDDELLSAVKDIFGSIRIPEVTVPDPVIETSSPSRPGLYTVKMADAKQSAVNMNIPTIRRGSPDYIDLRLTVIALGGYFGSRLMANIREDKGYTYGISSVLLGLPECGIVRIQTECDPQYTTGVLTEIDAELRKLVTHPPTGDELIRLKRFVRSSLASHIENPLTRMAYHIDGYTGGFDAESYYARQVEAVAKLSSERISEIAAKYLTPDTAITVVAGPEIKN